MNNINETETLLSFSSIEEMEFQIADLIAMEPTTSKAWYANKGFVSQADVYNIAIAELNAINTIDEAKAFKQKYSEIFMFNDNINDDELYNPYIPSDHFGYSLVCNKYGDVIINGEVKNFNNLTSVQQTSTYKMSHMPSTRAGLEIVKRDNYLYVYNGQGNKFWAEAKRDARDNIYIEYTAQRRRSFGWNHYSERYSITYISHDASSWTKCSFINYLFDNDKHITTNAMPAHTQTLIGIGRNIQTFPWNSYARFSIYSLEIKGGGAGELKINI